MKIRHWVSAAVALVFLSACGSVPTERFYRLDAIAPGDVTSLSIKQRLTVSPVIVPSALDRSQMVWRTSEHRLIIAEQSRWVEPLPGLIGRVMADNLARLLPGSIPVTPSTDAEIRIALDIRRLDAELRQPLVLEAAWSVQKAGSTRQGHSRLQEGVADAGIPAWVAAHERILLKLSREIAPTLN